MYARQSSGLQSNTKARNAAVHYKQLLAVGPEKLHAVGTEKSFCAASGCDAMLGGIVFPRRSYIGKLLGRFRCDAWVDRGSAAKLHRRGDCYFGSPAPGGLAGALFHRLVSPQVRDECSTPTSARVAGLVLAQFAVFASRLRMFEIPRRSFSIRILLSVARADHFFSLSDPEP